MKTKKQLQKAIKDTIKKYKEIIFSANIPVYIKCLDELQRQQVINKKVYDQKYEQKLMDDKLRKLGWDGLQKNIVMDGDTMIDRKTGEVLDSVVSFLSWKNKF